MIQEISKSLPTCLRKLFETSDFIILNKSILPINITLNFTTSGIYRIQGEAKVHHQCVPWSLILKIIQPENEEKDAHEHHNYWKREALVNQSGILDAFSNIISTPKCYLVEEKSDGIWLWMEEIQGDNNSAFLKEEWAFIAKKLGGFNGFYLMNSQLVPSDTWICPEWLKSWMNGCKMYAEDPLSYYEGIQKTNQEIDDLWKRFSQLTENIDSHFSTLARLPRVLAHQDLSQQNMYVSTDRLTLIDWQFMSLSAPGEDLGKLYGVAMSQGNFPQSDYLSYKDMLFESYIEGLRNSGWDGDLSLPQYGFNISIAMRCMWEVPKLMKFWQPLIPNNLMKRNREN